MCYSPSCFRQSFPFQEHSRITFSTLSPESPIIKVRLPSSKISQYCNIVTHYNYHSRFSSDFSLFRFRAARRSWSEKKWPHLILNLSLGVFSFDQCQETKASHIWNAPLIKTPLQRSTYYSSEPNAWDSNNSKRSIWFSFWWFFKELKPLSSETIPNRCPQLNLFCSAALFVEIIVICWQYMK